MGKHKPRANKVKKQLEREQQLEREKQLERENQRKSENDNADQCNSARNMTLPTYGVWYGGSNQHDPPSLFVRQSPEDPGSYQRVLIERFEGQSHDSATPLSLKDHPPPEIDRNSIMCRSYLDPERTVLLRFADLVLAKFDAVKDTFWAHYFRISRWRVKCAAELIRAARSQGYPEYVCEVSNYLAEQLCEDPIHDVTCRIDWNAQAGTEEQVFDSPEYYVNRSRIQHMPSMVVFLGLLLDLAEITEDTDFALGEMKNLPMSPKEWELSADGVYPSQRLSQRLPISHLSTVTSVKNQAKGLRVSIMDELFGSKQEKVLRELKRLVRADSVNSFSVLRKLYDTHISNPAVYQSKCLDLRKEPDDPELPTELGSEEATRKGLERAKHKYVATLESLFFLIFVPISYLDDSDEEKEAKKKVNPDADFRNNHLLKLGLDAALKKGDWPHSTAAYVRRTPNLFMYLARPTLRYEPPLNPDRDTHGGPSQLSDLLIADNNFLFPGEISQGSYMRDYGYIKSLLTLKKDIWILWACRGLKEAEALTNGLVNCYGLRRYGSGQVLVYDPGPEGEVTSPIFGSSIEAVEEGLSRSKGTIPTKRDLKCEKENSIEAHAKPSPVARKGDEKTCIETPLVVVAFLGDDKTTSEDLAKTERPCSNPEHAHKGQGGNIEQTKSHNGSRATASNDQNSSGIKSTSIERPKESDLSKTNASDTGEYQGEQKALDRIEGPEAHEKAQTTSLHDCTSSKTHIAKDTELHKSEKTDSESDSTTDGFNLRSTKQTTVSGTQTPSDDTENESQTAQEKYNDFMLHAKDLTQAINGLGKQLDDLKSPVEE